MYWAILYYNMSCKWQLNCCNVYWPLLDVGNNLHDWSLIWIYNQRIGAYTSCLRILICPFILLPGRRWQATYLHVYAHVPKRHQNCHYVIMVIVGYATPRLSLLQTRLNFIVCILYCIIKNVLFVISTLPPVSKLHLMHESLCYCQITSYNI